MPDINTDEFSEALNNKMDLEQSYGGAWYLIGYTPIEPENQ